MIPQVAVDQIQNIIAPITSSNTSSGKSMCDSTSLRATKINSDFGDTYNVNFMYPSAVNSSITGKKAIKKSRILYLFTRLTYCFFVSFENFNF